MTNLPALPSMASESAETRLAQQLQRGCSDARGAKLSVQCSTTGEWTLSASNDLTSAQLEHALREAAADEMFLVPCDEEQAEEAVVKLKAMTSRPPWMDASDAAVYEAGLIEALKAYPIDVVQTACVAWRQVPQHGKWWPTEQDLRVQCEAAYRPRKGLFQKARLLLDSLRITEAQKASLKESSYFAGERQKAFRAAMSERLLPDQFRAYFSAGHIRFVGGDGVLVRAAVAEQVLRSYGADIIAKLGIKLRHAPEHFERERVAIIEPSPEEDAEVSRKMSRLNAAMAKGENIKSLRAAGVL